MGTPRQRHGGAERPGAGGRPGRARRVNRPAAWRSAAVSQSPGVIVANDHP
jgi:hypothetical protein